MIAETYRNNFAKKSMGFQKQFVISRGGVLESLALNLQDLENCLVLGSRTALFFEWLKFCGSAEKCFSRLFFWRSMEKRFLKTFFRRKTLAFVSLALASSISVLGLGFFFVFLLASSLVSSTSPLVVTKRRSIAEQTTVHGYTLAYFVY